MKKCVKCGKMHDSNNMMYCNSCGGDLETVEAELCPDCKKPLKPGTRYCNSCGRPVSNGAGMPPYSGRPYVNNPERRMEVPKRSNKGILALIVVIIILIMALSATVTAMLLMQKDKTGSETEPKEKQETKISEEDDEDINEDKEEAEVIDKDKEETEEKPIDEEEGKETEAVKEEEEAEPVPQPAPEPPPQPAPQPKPVQPSTPSKTTLETSIDNYVQSFVLAMNYGDSSYMLDYVIPDSPLYRTQESFIENGWYEEYVDSYITGDIKLENSNSCVVSAYEIYNVQKPGESLKRTEQTATYRMKKDSDGYWKVYEFVGSVVTH